MEPPGKPPQSNYTPILKKETEWFTTEPKQGLSIKDAKIPLKGRVRSEAENLPSSLKSL